MLKKLAGVTFVIVLMSGCTPAQHQFWANWFAKDPVVAKAEFEKLVKAEPSQFARKDPPPVSEWVGAPKWSQCPQWYQMARAVGWTDSQWRTLDYIMYRESRCRPGAHNPSGASGLLQIMPMWASTCGVGRAELYEAVVNLSCGRVVLDRQGWGAWSTYNG